MSKYWKILDNDDISEDAILEKNDEFVGDSREKAEDI